MFHGPAAIVRIVRDTRVKVWLGELLPQMRRKTSLRSYNKSSCFQLMHLRVPWPGRLKNKNRRVLLRVCVDSEEDWNHLGSFLQQPTKVVMHRHGCRCVLWIALSCVCASFTWLQHTHDLCIGNMSVLWLGLWGIYTHSKWTKNGTDVNVFPSHNYLRKGDYVFASIGLFVCLSISLLAK